MGSTIRSPLRIRKVIRVEFDEDRSAEANLFIDMFHQRLPDRQFLDIQPVQGSQVSVRKLEECPLIPFEIDRQRERQGRHRIESPGMQ